jgi:hypothetical protein
LRFSGGATLKMQLEMAATLSKAVLLVSITLVYTRRRLLRAWPSLATALAFHYESKMSNITSTLFNATRIWAQLNVVNLLIWHLSARNWWRHR